MTSTPKKSAADSQPVFEINDTVIAQGIEDQEFSPDQQDPKYLMAYYEDRKIFVVNMDPKTGQIASDDPILVSDQAASFARSAYQGPEWGYNDNDGFSLFFTVENGRKTQIAQSTRQSDGQWSRPVVLTGNQTDQFGRMGATGSRNGKTVTPVNYTRWAPTPGEQHHGAPKDRLTNRVFYWMEPNERKEYQVDDVVIFEQPPHFLDQFEGSSFCELLFSQSKDGLDQVVRYNTQTGESHFLTSLDTDLGNKWNHWDPSAFRAYDPQYNGAVVYTVSAAHYDKKHPRKNEKYPARIAIYEQVSDDPYAELEFQRTLEIPERARLAGFTSISSVETIAGPKLKSSFLSVRLVRHNDVNPLDWDASIWLWSLDGRLQRQVSGNGPDPGNLHGKDPEYLVGTEKLYLYYNYYPKRGPIDLHLCETGVSADGSFTAGPEGE